MGGLGWLLVGHAAGRESGFQEGLDEARRRIGGEPEEPEEPDSEPQPPVPPVKPGQWFVALATLGICLAMATAITAFIQDFKASPEAQMFDTRIGWLGVIGVLMDLAPLVVLLVGIAQPFSLVIQHFAHAKQEASKA